MRNRLCVFFGFALTAVFTMLCFAQRVEPEEDKNRLKREQIEQILKADHAKSVEDAGQLLKLAEDLKIELERSDRHVLSLSAIKKTEEIEKIAKRIRGRMRRF